MNYDVYEVEVETGIPGFRLLQHIKATDATDAQVRVEQIQSAKCIEVSFRRPCTDAEIAVAVAAGIVPDGTTATVIADVEAL
jgi:ACT domain-containing protein